MTKLKSTKNVSTAAKRGHRIQDFFTAQLTYALSDGSGEKRALALRDKSLAMLTPNERFYAAAIALGMKNVLQGLRNGRPESELGGVAAANEEVLAHAGASLA